MSEPTRANRRTAFLALPFLITAVVVGWSWAPMLDLHLTGEDYTLLARIDRGLEASPHVFRPLLGFWLSALHAIFGAESGFPYHVGSLLLHLANTTLVYLLARRLFDSAWTAGACAAVFGLGAGVRDALFWVAAVNRPLATFGALLALNGALRITRSSVVPAVLCGVGMLWQFASNEDFYGTALVVFAWCAWKAFSEPRFRKRVFATGGFGVALLLIHYFLIHRVPGGAGAVVESGLSQAFQSAQTRSAAIAQGIGMPGFFGLILPLLGAMGILVSGRREAAFFCLLAWIGSFVPFVLSDAVGYRFYPTQAPVALLFAGGLLGIFTKTFRWSAVPQVGFVVVVVLSALGSRHARQAGLLRWHAALGEIRACDEPLRDLAALAPDEAPISVNIDTTTMGLVYYLWPSIPDPSDVRFFGFLDGASGFVRPDGAPEGTWFGRRCEGSFGVIEPERYFAQRAELEKVRLYHKAEAASSLNDARERLADIDFDLTETALIEPTGLPITLDPEANAGAKLAILEPFEVLVLNVSARIKVAVETEADVIVGFQDNWLYDPLYRIPPDQTIFSGVRKVRGYVLEAKTEAGVELETFPLNAFGLGALVPAGKHTIEVRFRKRSPFEMR